MADLVRETQFEKICPFPVLNEVMENLAQLEASYSKINFMDVQHDLRVACNAFLVCGDKEDALELAAQVLLYLKEIHTARQLFKPDS